MAIAAPAYAVTDKEMEEARTITAKAYLRYANDGSGYLDDISATDMQALTSRLKDKEKENLKAFNAVRIPSDYASWDKEKLTEYWSVTFFQSPGLSEKGKGARTRVRAAISKMSVTAPSETPAPADAEADAAALPAEEASAADMTPPQNADSLLADQQAIQEDAEAREAAPAEENHTVIYVIVLVILIGVVIWLVVYAANLMKKQPGSAGDGGDVDSLREKAREAVAAKNDEISRLMRQLDDEKARSAAFADEAERLKLDNKRLLSQIEKMRLERAERPERQASPRQEAPARRVAPAEPEEIIRRIYLGRANARGIFVRADRRVSTGNSVYVLDTDDGLVGTFRVIDNAEVIDRVLDRPEEYLAGGCQGEDLDDTAGVTRIVTEGAGTAIFENGYWKVLRKSKIRYE